MSGGIADIGHIETGGGYDAGPWWLRVRNCLRGGINACPFRLFDIVKPWPIRWLDRNVAGGFGVMIDDVLAGLMALLCLQLIARISI